MENSFRAMNLKGAGRRLSNSTIVKDSTTINDIVPPADNDGNSNVATTADTVVNKIKGKYRSKPSDSSGSDANSSSDVDVETISDDENGIFYQQDLGHGPINVYDESVEQDADIGSTETDTASESETTSTDDYSSGQRKYTSASVATPKRKYTKRSAKSSSGSKRTNDPDWKHSIPNSTDAIPYQTKPKRKYTRKNSTDIKRKGGAVGRKRKSQLNENNEGSGSSDSDSEEELVQCLSLNCVEAARKGSKYCSQDCCLQLAKDRINAILPGRVQDWFAHPSVAEAKNKIEVEGKVKLMEDIQTKLKNLNKQRMEVEEHIEVITGEILEPGEVAPEAVDEEGTSYCVSCGQEVTAKSFLKHMNKCFHKLENQRCVVSLNKVMTEGPPLFCAYFNTSDKTYCCRLKVLCTQHNKPFKLIDGQICGYKLSPGAITYEDQAYHGICRLLKTKCGRHYAWEKKQLADIDLQRLNLFKKMDEVGLEIRNLELAMKSRNSLMSLLLHHTTVHDSPQSQHPMPFVPSMGFGGGIDVRPSTSATLTHSCDVGHNSGSCTRSNCKREPRTTAYNSSSSNSGDFAFKIPSTPAPRRKSRKH